MRNWNFNNIQQFRADADGASFIAEQLQYISPRVIETVFAAPEWQEHIPLEAGNNPLVEQMGYDVLTAAGVAEVFEGDGWNLPEVGVARDRVLTNVYPIGINRAISDDKLAQAAFEAVRLRAMNPGAQPVALDEAEERAAARAVAMSHDSIALNGLASVGLLGLLNQPNITNYPAPVGVGGSALWTVKTAAEIVADMVALISLVMNTAKEATYYPDRLLLPLDKYLIASTKQMEGTNETALSFFQRTNPLGNRLQVKSWHRLNGQGTGNTGRAFAYKYDEDVISYRAPRLYYVHTPPARGPAGWTWTHSGRSGGTAVKQPFAVAQMQGF